MFYVVLVIDIYTFLLNKQYYILFLFFFFLAVTCDTLDIEGATVSYSDNQNIGSKATVTCADENHSVVGKSGGVNFIVKKSTTTCTKDGDTATWRVTIAGDTSDTATWDLTCEKGRLNSSILKLLLN